MVYFESMCVIITNYFFCFVGREYYLELLPRSLISANEIMLEQDDTNWTGVGCEIMSFWIENFEIYVFSNIEKIHVGCVHEQC